MHPALAHGGRIASRTADEEVFNVGHIIEYFILSPLVVQQTRLYVFFFRILIAIANIRLHIYIHIYMPT